MEYRYAEVITDNKSLSLNRPFTYKIGPGLVGKIRPGMRVIIPFGRSNRTIKGLVIGLLEDFDRDIELKEIVDLIDDEPIIDESLIGLASWMRDEYLSSYYDSVQLILPPGDIKKIKVYIKFLRDGGLDTKEEETLISLVKGGPIEYQDLKERASIEDFKDVLLSLEIKGNIKKVFDIEDNIKAKEKEIVGLSKEFSKDEILGKIRLNAHRQIEVVEYLSRKGEDSIDSIREELGVSRSTIASLIDRKLLSYRKEAYYRKVLDEDISTYKKHKLNSQQESVYKEIIASTDRSMDKFLIHGVTGSGKTEVYLQLVEHFLKRGKSSIILVPEISLTPQTISRFAGRFGDEVSVLHSKLSYGERFDQWRRIRSGESRIVVGARSAIFAPVRNLGLIIIDEEHDSSYKSSKNPKYKTIRVAEKRLDLEGGILVLGTATPSLDSYYRTNKDIKLLTMDNRVGQLKLPEVKVVDMREELNKGNRTIFSQDLYKALEENLSRSQQSMLFLNRRGFSTFISCRSCGYTVECKACDVSMTYHRNKNLLICHYCGLSQKPPLICPSCQSKDIRYFGIGTERIEAYVKSVFPGARVIRVDRDTTKAKNSHRQLMDKIKNKEVDIIIGTQMISKGLDFESISLVGVVAADTSLNLPNYKAQETTFQLLTQVAGRAGRGDLGGRVIIQTYNPGHYSIQLAKNHDYVGFYNEEIKLREEFLYPPFVDLISLTISGPNLTEVKAFADRLREIIEEEAYNEGDLRNIDITGPYPAPIEKIKNDYRWILVLKIKKDSDEKLKNIIYRVCISNEYNLDMKNNRINIDIDPDGIL